MKALLRIPVRLCPDRGRSAISRQQSELSCQQSAFSYQLPAKHWLIPKKELSVIGSQLSDSSRFTRFIGNLIPKTYNLIPKKELSAVGNQISDTIRFTRFIGKLILKTYHLIAIFFLVFVSCGAALAQESVGNTAPAAQAETEITPLKVGDKIPDELWEMYFPVVSANSDKVQYLSLGDFKDKLIILDFWSTWCGSCIYAFPTTYALANQFKDDLLLMPVGPNTEVEIRKFIGTHKNGKYLMESIMDKEILKQYFPHRFIPHFVWIYDGKIVSVTKADQLKSINVENILKGKNVTIRQKNDVFDFDLTDPFEENWESLFEKNIVAKTTLTNFVDGIGSWEAVYYENDSSIYRSAAVNRSLINIYNWAVNMPWNYFLNESLDKSKFQDADDDPDWYMKNTYCYELLVPGEMSTAQRSDIIINDLNAKLNLNSRLEMRMMDCYVLVHNEDWKDEDIISQVDPNIKRVSLDEIATIFNNRRKFDRRSYQSPPILINEVVNNENYYPSPYAVIDIDGFNEFMKPQGVMAVPAKREIEVFIMSDF